MKTLLAFLALAPLALAGTAQASTPVVTSVSPADLATDVPRLAKVSVGFDQPMNKASAQAAFSLVTQQATTSGAFSWSGNTMTFTPSAPLASGADYAAKEMGAKNLAGDGASAQRAWIFVTASQPIVKSLSPANGATGVYPNRAVTVTFDRPMDTAATQAAFTLSRTSDGARMPGRVSWSGNTMSFRPLPDLAANVQYTATLTTGARDLAGHPIPTAKAWRYTTLPHAIIDSVFPTPGMQGVMPDTKVRVAFSEPMDKAAAEHAFSLQFDEGSPRPGTFSWSGNTMIFTPTSPLDMNWSFQASVTTLAQSATGYTLVAPKAWWFSIWPSGMG